METKDDVMARIDQNLRDSGTIELSMRSDLLCAFGVLYDALAPKAEEPLREKVAKAIECDWDAFGNREQVLRCADRVLVALGLTKP